MTDINKSLINIGAGKVPEKIYDDILSGPSKKVGEALGTILNIGNTLLWPVKWANERTRIYFEANLKKYERKMETVDDDKIIEVPTEISMPILERFSYVSNEDISNAFINLLTSASSVDTIQFAHPSFIQIIDRLSPDEAKILKYLSDNNPVPYITLSRYKLKDRAPEDLFNSDFKDELDFSKYSTLIDNYCEIKNHVNLNFTDNINLYIDNITSLGLVRNVDEYTYLRLEEKFEELIVKIKADYEDKFVNIPAVLRDEAHKILKGMFELTEFGKLFVKSSIL